MNPKYSPQLLALVLIFAAMLAWLTVPILNEYGSSRLKIALIGSVGTGLLIIYLVNARRRLSDRVKGRISEDELSRLARLNAGHAAFMMSMVLWLAIFAVQNVFDSTRTMLGAGILGQCGFYGICLVFFNRTGSLHEDQD